MPALLEKLLSVVLVASAVVIAGVLVHREFFESKVAAAGPVSSYMDEWRSAVTGGHLTGKVDAPVVLLEFSDLQCPFCREFNTSVQRVRQRFGDDVAFVFVHAPIRSHPQALPAARAAECGQPSGHFIDMVDAIYKEQDSVGVVPWTYYAVKAGIKDTAAFAACARATVEIPLINKGKEVSRRLQITGTPTVVLNGWRYGSAPSDTELSRAINDLLAARVPYKTYPRRALPRLGARQAP